MKQLNSSGNVNAGEHYKAEYNLETDGRSNTLEIPVLGFNIASVVITTIGATGTAGTARMKQSVSGEPGTNFSPDATLVVGPSGSTSVFGLPVTGSKLKIDLSQVTFGIIGRLIVEVVLKKN